MKSTWIFGCKMGLSQDTCGEYVKDPNSRGANRWASCPSCVHRKPYDDATAEAEDYHAEHPSKVSAQ